MATYNLTSSIPAATSLKKGDILNCPYSGAAKSITLPKGKYKLEVWGAEGAIWPSEKAKSSGSGEGGKGGYSQGILSLKQATLAFLYAGGKGIQGYEKSGGFNGGGNSRKSNSVNWNGGSGGGASDIRLLVDSLFARIIVAGGGGGTPHWNVVSGGAGGGTTGITPTKYTSTNVAATGGTQIGPGVKGYYSAAENKDVFTVPAGFGTAAQFNQTISGNYEGAGGGGGWYGGGSGIYVAGAGGSGWIYTAAAFNTWKAGNANDAAQWKLNSDYYLSEASMKNGAESIVDPESGNSTIGRAGNGYVRITVLEVEGNSSPAINVIVNDSYKKGKELFVYVNDTLKFRKVKELFVMDDTGQWRRSK